MADTEECGENPHLSSFEIHTINGWNPKTDNT